MSRHRPCTMWLLLAAAPWLTPWRGAAAETQTVLVADGQAHCAIWVAERVMAADQDAGGRPSAVQRAEAHRQRLRESVQDLAQYCEKMSGVQVPIHTGAMAATGGPIPILIGELGVEKYGPPDRQFADQQAFRIVVAEDAVGLFGQSDLTTSYAIYTLLDRLGCRWYMPGEWGEVIPELKTIALDRNDENGAPFTIYRDIWHSDPVYVPGNKDLRHLVEGWGRAKPAVSYYLYCWFLAEANAPNPLITKWSTDIPILYRNHCAFWQPEGITNFETTMHGIYLGLRLAWDPQQDPAQILQELNERFYGHAREQMAAYWRFVDEIWVDTPEYSGCCWGYLTRFTPQRLSEMRRLMDAATAAAATETERARITLSDDSLHLFELFMKMRRDLAEGRFATLPADMQTYADRATVLADQYAPQKSFGKMYWVHSIHSDFYFNTFCRPSYTDAARIADPDSFVLLTAPPVRQFHYRADPDKQGEQLGWTQPDFDDQLWSVTDPCLQTWSSLGLHDYMGMMWYRTNVDLTDVPHGKRVHLWVSATDGSAKLYVNGRHVPYVQQVRDADGNVTTTTTDAFTGYAAPASFDITAAVTPGRNQVTLQCARRSQNELGTGGLLGPVVVYREK